MRRELARAVDRLTAVELDVSTAVPGLLLYRRTEPTFGSCSFQQAAIALIAQGSKQVSVGKDVYVYDESHFLLTSVDLPTVSRVLEASPERPYLALLLRLDLQLTRQLIADFDLETSVQSPVCRGIGTSPATREILSAFARLVELLDRPRDIPFLAGLIQRELLYRLLTTEHGVRLRQIASSGSQGNRVAKAITWLKQNYRRPLRLEELAGNVQMGVSTLHHHFRAVTAMSPLQYQKQLRLHEARRLMLIESLDVGSAAFSVGYESATQFSREYSRLFGQPPMRDVRSLRALSEVRREV